MADRQALIDAGEKLKRQAFSLKEMSHERRREFSIRAQRWFNEAAAVLRDVPTASAAELGKRFNQTRERIALGDRYYVIDDVQWVMDQLEALPAAEIPRSAFVLMWMDKLQPGLADTLQLIKDVCAEFRIAAERADDIEHQGAITGVVLDRIRAAELLIADLTGERPNVYYEVGYAHAAGKQPILVRRTGTPLHFDLSVHNVPEYAGLDELREILTRRLEALTGKRPGAH
jgi:hypothetical protein